MAQDINDTANRARYTATSAQVSFTVPFEFTANADLKVYQNGTLKTLTTHYTVTGAGVTGGGSITLVTGATLNDDILIVRDIPTDRQGDFPTSGIFDIESLNSQLDKHVMMIKDLDTRLDRRSLVLSVTDKPEDLNDLPAKADRASKVLAFDADGQPIAQAADGHTHQLSGVAGLEAALDDKAGVIHTHLIADVTGLQSALNGKASSTHAHAISDVTNLQTSLDGKAASVHNHAISDVTGLQTSLDGKAASSHTHDDRYYTETETDSLLSGKAASSHTHDDRYYTEGEVDTLLSGKAASSHSHAISDTTGLQTALDGKASSSHTHTASGITDFSEAVDDRVNSLLVAGSNVTLTYDDTANTMTIASSGGGGGSGSGDALVGSTNTFTASQIISTTDNTNAALRITQTGTGNALVVEDSTNPDSTPFVIDSSGRMTTSSAVNLTGSSHTNTSAASVLNMSQTWNAPTIAVTAASGNGTSVTLTHTEQASAVPVGSTINVSGFTPSGYNTATGAVTASTTTTTTYTNATTATVTILGTLQTNIVAPIFLNVTNTSSSGVPWLLDLRVNGGNVFGVTRTGGINSSAGLLIQNSAAITWSGRGLLSSPAVGGIQLGTTDAAAPVAQTLSAQSVVAGTTNIAGQDLTIRGSRGTGTGAGGAIALQTAPASTTGSTQNAAVERMRITPAGDVGIGTATPSGRLEVIGGVANSITALGTGDAASLVVTNSDVSGLGRISKTLYEVGNLSLAAVGAVYSAFNAGGDIGGDLVFGTQTNLAGGVVERLRISKDGAFGIAGTNYGTSGQFIKSGGSAAAPSWASLAISDVTSLQTSLDGKASSTHSHAISDVTGLQTAIDGKAATTHTHAISDTTGLQTALDGKAASSHTHTASAITDFSEAVDDEVASLLVAGSGITLTYDDGANTLAIASTASGNLSILNTQTFNASGTWSKSGISGSPKFVIARAWGAGGSGRRNQSTNSGAGGGGAFHEAVFSYDLLAATVSATVGAGGAARTTNTDGQTGGSSNFSSLSAPGGTGGSGATGGQGGNLSADIASVTGRSRLASTYMWDPTTATGSISATTIGNSTPTLLRDDGAAGGSGAATPVAGFNGVYGSGGGGGSTSGSGAAGGTSTYGGAGGAGNGSSNGTAGSGSAPGGGGGGASGSGSSISGAGAAGRVIIYTIG